MLVTEWANVGSYRRALGDYEVKLYATPLLAQAIDVPSAFEPLLTAAPGAEPIRRHERSGLTVDAPVAAR